ncbi:hypothetical protein PENTCL1PPCAC_3048, partial [Pristionchus entomophagus]
PVVPVVPVVPAALAEPALMPSGRRSNARGGRGGRSRSLAFSAFQRIHGQDGNDDDVDSEVAADAACSSNASRAETPPPLLHLPQATTASPQKPSTSAAADAARSDAMPPKSAREVEGQWAKEMELIGAVRSDIDSITVTKFGQIKLDDSSKGLVARMSALISPQSQFEGLDKVKLLSQLDASAIEVIYRATVAGSKAAGKAWPFASASPSPLFLEEGETRMAVLKLQIAMVSLSLLYADPMDNVEQREDLQQHLTGLMKKVNAIRRSTVMATEDPSETNGLTMAIKAMTDWRVNVQFLLGLEDKWDSSSAESSPVKKRPRVD